MSTLRDRLREIVRPHGYPPGGVQPDTAFAPAVPAGGLTTLEEVLGGTWIRGGRSFLVERRIPAEASCGRTTVGCIGAQIRRYAAQLPLLDSRTCARLPLLFFDLETTGLSGGAGTYAFLIGYGSFDERDRFVTRQHVLVDPSAEPAMLEAAESDSAGAGALVSFNGKTFDAPVLDTRYALHRLNREARGVPHVDVLHPARRFWADHERPASESGGCSLVALEHRILGAARQEDVPGFEIPARYFEFLRSQDARPLAGVLDHNRLDLLSLAGIAGRLLELLATGLEETVAAGEALALGHLYERGGMTSRAFEAFRAAARPEAPRRVRIEALRRLAVLHRRARQYSEAAGCWRQLLDLPRCPGDIAREASEALAIHHEHRNHDLDAAKRFALLSLGGEENRAWHDAVRHRLARLDRKMNASGRLSLPASLPSLSRPSPPACGSQRSARQTSS